MIKLPKWVFVENCYVNKVGVYKMVLKQSEGRWLLEIWEMQDVKMVAKHHFITKDVYVLQKIAFDCLNNILKEIR